jgi:hypothetical protein
VPVLKTVVGKIHAGFVEMLWRSGRACRDALTSEPRCGSSMRDERLDWPEPAVVEICSAWRSFGRACVRARQEIWEGRAAPVRCSA